MNPNSTKELDTETLVSLSSLYTKIQSKIKELEQEKADIKSVLFTHFDLTVGEGEPAVIDCGDGFRLKRERRSSKSIDEKKLEEILEPTIWKKVTVTKRELSETKLKKAMTEGTVKQSDVKKAVVERVTFAFTHPVVKQEQENI